MPAINDGSLPYGSIVITIATVAYVAENVKLDSPTNILTRKDQVGEPSGQVAVADFVTGSATLQLATTATVHPALGATFTADLTVAGSTQTYFVSKVSPSLGQEEIKKVDIEFRKKINA